jgi:hypothetical protein
VQGRPGRRYELTDEAFERIEPLLPKLTAAQRVAIKRMQSAHLKGVPVGKKAIVTGSGIRYVDRTDYVAELDAPEELMQPPKPKRPRPPKPKHDPKYIAAARELRDRYLEEVNSGMLLPPAAQGKYDVSRARTLPAASTKLDVLTLPEAT